MPQPVSPGSAASRTFHVYRRSWSIEAFGEQLLVVRRIDLHPAERPLDPVFVTPFIGRWLAESSSRTSLWEMYDYVFGPRGKARNAGERIAELDRAFRRGDLLVIRGLLPPRPEAGPALEPEVAAAAAASADAPSPAPAPKEVAEKTWFRCQLLDEDGEPMANEPYQLKDSSGAVREGKLDQDGCVYIPPILPPGNCVISFPKMHLNPRKKGK